MKIKVLNVYEDLVGYIHELINKYPPQDGLKIENKVVYSNANDGTDFDWVMNDRTCEFEIFFEGSDYIYLKVFATKDGFIKGYVWTNYDGNNTIKLEPYEIGKTRAEKLRDFGLALDAFHHWDKEIFTI